MGDIPLRMRINMRKWEDLPEYMKCDEVKEYYDILSKKNSA